QWTAKGKLSQSALLILSAHLLGISGAFRVLLWNLGTLDFQFLRRLRLILFDAAAEFFDHGPAPDNLAERTETIHEQNAESVFPGPACPQRFRQRGRLPAAVSIPICAREIVFEFAHRFLDGMVGIGCGGSDITQFH